METLKFSTAKTTQWSGGETHELLIHPRNGNFKDGNYDLRISIATVNLESTVFTSLPGVSRTLTVLEGNLILNHEGKHSVQLSQYEQDSFQGDWITRSEGKVKDFNVMTKKGNATVKHMSYSPSSFINLEHRNDLTLLFLAKGKCKVTETIIGTEDLLVLSENTDIEMIEQCEFLQISYNY